MRPSEAFRERLRRARSSRGLTQAQVAESIDMNVASYGKLESGERRVTLDEAIACGAVLDVPFAVLLTPFDPFGDARQVELAPGVEVDGATALLWASGLRPLTEGDERSYAAELEGASTGSPGIGHLRHLVSVLGEAWVANNPDKMAAIAEKIERELERQWDEIDVMRLEKRGREWEQFEREAPPEPKRPEARRRGSRN